MKLTSHAPPSFSCSSGSGAVFGLSNWEIGLSLGGPWKIVGFSWKKESDAPVTIVFRVVVFFLTDPD
mgnify:CR=1 FL=1